MYKWIKVVHVIGFLMWSGSLVACLMLLQQQASTTGETRSLLTEIERKFALMMDIGATIAIGAGLYMALVKLPWLAQKNWFTAKGLEGKSMGVWLHMKLLFVVFLIGLHGFTRVKLGKIRKGTDTTVPGFALPVALFLIAIIIVMATVKPMSGLP